MICYPRRQEVYAAIRKLKDRIAQREKTAARGYSMTNANAETIRQASHKRRLFDMYGVKKLLFKKNYCAKFPHFACLFEIIFVSLRRILISKSQNNFNLESVLAKKHRI